MRRLRLLAVGAVTSIFAAFGVVAPAQAAVDYFLEIDGVTGESQDAKFQKAIDVQSYSWGASNDKKGVRLQDVSVSKFVDLASPPLFQRLAQGTTIPSMELIARSAGGEQVIFLRYCFQNVQVSSVSHGGNTGGENPREQVSFAYGAVSEQYSSQDSKGGIDQTVFAGWNATTGQLIPSYPANCGHPGP